MRPTPLDLVFRESAQEVFPGIRQGLEQAEYDARDRDQFLMLREVVTLLHQLRPEEGVGEGIEQLAALLHHAYLFWEAQEHTVEVSLEQLPALLSGRTMAPETEPTALYAAFPPRRVWAPVIPEQAPEPLDGCFIHSAPDPAVLRVLGVFGIHPDRPGFSVVEAVGRQPLSLVRSDGSELFAPTLTGGEAAGLFTIAGEEELLHLGWLARGLAAHSAAGTS